MKIMVSRSRDLNTLTRSSIVIDTFLIIRSCMYDVLCECVCVREREREKEKERARGNTFFISLAISLSHSLSLLHTHFHPCAQRTRTRRKTSDLQACPAYLCSCHTRTPTPPHQPTHHPNAQKHKRGHFLSQRLRKKRIEK
jgi:hypothetical protein